MSSGCFFADLDAHFTLKRLPREIAGQSSSSS